MTLARDAGALVPGLHSYLGVYGLITERDFGLAESVFPGIGRLYRELPEKPRTFLQLVWLYASWHETQTDCAAARTERPFLDGVGKRSVKNVATVAHR
jgi:hypothetical protein